MGSTATLMFDGHYASGLTPWEEWHAGVPMHGRRVHYRRYFADARWLGCYREKPFDFWQQSQSLNDAGLLRAAQGDSPTTGDADPMWLAGKYEIEGDTLIESFAPAHSAGHVWQTRYTIMNDRLLVGSQGRDRVLLFVPARDW